MAVMGERSSLGAVSTPSAVSGVRSSLCNGCPSSLSGKACLRGVHGPQADHGDFF